MMLRHAAAFCLLHLVPKPILRRRLARALSVGPYAFHPTFSGRVGLYRLALALRPVDRRPVALTPDYVCNIVPRALATAGYEVVPYPTDRLLEPDWAALTALADARGATLLVGASVFGSSGLIGDLNDPAKLAQLRARGMSVIADIAQDVSLRARLPQDGSDLVHAVLSFNNKSFPGAMGGGVLTALRLSAPSTPLGIGRVARLYRDFIVQTYLAPLARMLGRQPAPKPGLDYSYCAEFPYEIPAADFEPAKAQFAAALVGLGMLGGFARRKAPLLGRHRHLATAFADSAAYLVMDGPVSPADPVSGDRLRKQPYALEGTPDRGLREGEIIVHNKGFLDRRKGF